VYWWLWRTDPSHGGTGDSDFTPHGKPAEAVLRRWYGNFSASCAAAGGGAYRPFVQPDGSFEMRPGAQLAYATPADNACDGSDTVAAAVAKTSQRWASEGRRDGATKTLRTWNGFCFGGPDQWSSPYYRYDSAGARASADAAAALGADTLEVIVQVGGVLRLAPLPCPSSSAAPTRAAVSSLPDHACSGTSRTSLTLPSTPSRTRPTRYARLRTMSWPPSSRTSRERVR